MSTYLCECGDERCTAPIRLTRVEYEAVRAYPTRFALALNHENPEIDGKDGSPVRFWRGSKRETAGQAG
jgi:hypothetical protein